MSEPTDQDLIKRTLSGEANAFGQLVQRYQTSIFNVCYRMVHNWQEAEDLTQEAFIRAYKRLHTYDPSRSFGPWMRKVAANNCLNRLERKSFKLSPLDESAERIANGGSENPESLAVKHEDVAHIRAAISKLSPKFRAVIELRHFQGMAYEDIAEQLDLSLGAVKTNLFRARKQLAELLKPVTMK